MNDHKKQYTILGCGIGWGSGYNGTGRAPDVLREWGLTDQLCAAGHDVDWHATWMPTQANPQFDPRLDVAYADVLGFNRVVCDKTTEILNGLPNKIPVFIGGDHSMAFGTWPGVIKAFDGYGEFGLIWVDAHMDAHTPVTSVQGKWGGHFHGMPLAHLLGHGDKALCEIGDPRPKLNPSTTVLIGIRSYEPGEEALLNELGVRIIKMDEVHERGVKACWDEAVGIASAGPKGWGMSIDLDAFDPTDAPAVGTPEAGGLDLNDFILAFQHCHIKDFKAVEFTEYNAVKDENFYTAKALYRLMNGLL